MDADASVNADDIHRDLARRYDVPQCCRRHCLNPFAGTPPRCAGVFSAVGPDRNI